MLSHPKSKLRAVTLYPGSRLQVGLVRRVRKVFRSFLHLSQVLREVGREDVLVGGYNKDHPKDCVSAFHFKIYNDIVREDPDDTGAAVINKVVTDFPNTTIITGI